MEDGLGDAALVAPVYRAYQRLVMAYGDSPRPWPLSADEQVLAEQWESAELAAVTAAFGSDRYMGDADYSIEVGTDTPADAGSFFD